jgi:hypothetical protein
MIAEWRGEPHHRIGYRYLHGAWAMRDCGPYAAAKNPVWQPDTLA